MATGHAPRTTRICRAIEAICNRGDFAAADALFTPDYVNHGGLIPDLVRGPEALKVAVALYRAAFPDFTVTVVPLRARGATVLLRWSAERRPRGAPIAGVPADTTAGVTGITRGRLEGGRIAESWTRWDAARVLRQLGLVTTG
jgi:steroid delta-isomerase-like uncharacterized protein